MSSFGLLLIYTLTVHRQKKFSMEKDEVQMSERLKRFGDMVKPQEKKKTSFIDMIHQMVSLCVHVKLNNGLVCV